jgi:predicted nucleic acid-binding protein
MKTLPKQAALDTNVLVALVDSHYKWHARAIALRDALKAEEVDVVYFDPVINEAVSVLARRSEEQKRSEQFGDLLNTLMQQVSVQNVTWLSSETLRLYEDVLDLVRRTPEG